jgi:hypothetical protein
MLKSGQFTSVFGTVAIKKINPAVINTGIYYCRIFYYKVLEADYRRGCTSRTRFKITSGN